MVGEAVSFDTAGPLPAVDKFAYDALDDRGRRRPPMSRIKAEDDHATAVKRRKLSATTQDLERNFELAAWAIRKHLDYVTQFRFCAKTPDREYNKFLESYVAGLQTRERFDVARRHDMGRAIRIAEACRIKDGDVGLLKITARPGAPFRGMIQGIEADRIEMPRTERPEDADSWVNGVRVGTSGAALAYAISDRDKQGRLRLAKIVPARNLIHHACFGRFDQVRGVSPLAAALNRWRDTYEAFDYAHAKLKLGQLFGLEIYREGESPLFGDGTATATIDGDGDSTNDAGYEVDLSTGIFTLDLDPGDRAGILESKTPSTETVKFLELAVQLALKSLDIPFSFFSENFTNFFGSRGALLHYQRSCDHKIDDLQKTQDAWARWRLGIEVADGNLELPRGESFDFLKWEFTPVGIPWWDPVKEAKGAAMAIAIGASNPYREAVNTGTRFEDNIDATADALAYAEAKGVTLKFADSESFAPEVGTQETDDGADNAE